jgi:hypothetical protein
MTRSPSRGIWIVQSARTRSGAKSKSGENGRWDEKPGDRRAVYARTSEPRGVPFYRKEKQLKITTKKGRGGSEEMIWQK